MTETECFEADLSGTIPCDAEALLGAITRVRWDAIKQGIAPDDEHWLLVAGVDLKPDLAVMSYRNNGYYLLSFPPEGEQQKFWDIPVVFDQSESMRGRLVLAAVGGSMSTHRSSSKARRSRNRWARSTSGSSSDHFHQNSKASTTGLMLAVGLR